ncbi:MAG: tripartite tricarboxylate transporter permease [Kiritimatiellia bacterium]
MSLAAFALTTVLAAGAGSIVGCLPGLHVYTLLSLLVAAPFSSPEFLIATAIGLVVGYAMLNTVPSVLLAAPDESAFLTVLPGQKFLMRGLGYDALQITAAGGLMAVLLLVVLAGPLAHKFLPLLHTVLKRHYHWILWCVILFMLMSEWPRGELVGETGKRRLLSAWRSLGIGLLTFLLSGVLGLVLFHRSPLPPWSGTQTLMPAFTGLFTLPWLLLNIVTKTRPPRQQTKESAMLPLNILLKGAISGGMGGAFAALVPAVTGGVGGYLAGHATAIRDDRTFLVAQGAAKLVYYGGGLLLLFVPEVHLSRGTAASIIKSLWTPDGPQAYLLALAATALAGSTAYLLVVPLGRITIAAINRFALRNLSLTAFGLIMSAVRLITGPMGLLVALVAAGIGLLPLLYGSRRMNCLGVILLPAACNISGISSSLAGWLGLG